LSFYCFKPQQTFAPKISFLFSPELRSINFKINHTIVIARRAKVIIQPYNGHFPTGNGHHTTIQWSFPNGKWSSYNHTMAISHRVFCNFMPLMPWERTGYTPFDGNKCG